MAQVRIAVIGSGLIGRTHIAVLRSGNPDYGLAAGDYVTLPQCGLLLNLDHIVGMRAYLSM